MMPLPAGFVLDEDPGGGDVPLPPGFQLDEPQASGDPRDSRTVRQNAMAEIRSIPGQIASAATFPKEMLLDAPTRLAKSAYEAATGPTRFMDTESGQDLKDAMNVPREMIDRAAHPIRSFRREPIRTTMDVASLAAGGVRALRPVAAGAGPRIADAAEQLSGLEHRTPGILKDAYKDSGLIFGPDKDKARAMYREVADDSSIRQGLADEGSKIDLVTAAKKIIREGGKLTPDEALEARKALDFTKKHWSDLFFRQTRDMFDKVAKETFAAADKNYQRATKSEALRSALPLNKTGGASAFKTALLTPLLPLMSPAVQGAVATASGAVARRILRPLSNAAPKLGAGSLALSANGGLASDKGPDFQNDLNGQDNQNRSDREINPKNSKAKNHNAPNRLLKPKQEKILTADIAKKYLKQARGDRSIARQMAKRDGWTIPE